MMNNVETNKDESFRVIVPLGNEKNRSVMSIIICEVKINCEEKISLSKSGYESLVLNQFYLISSSNKQSK